MLVGVSRIQRVGWANRFLKGRVIAFPLRETCSSLKNGCCGIRIYLSTENPACTPPYLSLKPPTPDFPRTTPDCAVLPCLSPRWVTRNVNPVGPLEPTKKKKKKKKKGSFVSSGLHLSPVGKIHMAFYHWMLCGQEIPALAFCAWKPSSGSRLYSGVQGKLPQPCSNFGLAACKRHQPLLCPRPFYQSWVVFAHH